MTYGTPGIPDAGSRPTLRLDPASVELVQDSVRRLRGHEDELATIFYDNLFRAVPEARRLFADDMTEQRVRLLGALLAAVDALHEPAAMEERLLALGAEHYHRGVEEHQFHYVAQALVRAVRELIPEEWSSPLSSAWIGLYTWMITFLVAGSRDERTRLQD